ncbi:MAG: hypothetical protein K2M39_02820 [Muribaculaceae bacterium]|nr:hypothetical protein [Muribaculaceae bacterium]
MDKEMNQAFFKIVAGGITQFAFFEENYNSISEENQLDSSVSFTVETHKRIIKATAIANLYQSNMPVLKCVVDLVFQIKNDSWDSFANRNKILIPQELLVYFGSKAVGALRGALFAKLEQMPIHIVLPLVNLNEIITEPMVVEMH